MALPKPKPELSLPIAAAHPTARTGEPRGALAMPSPARALQQLLDERTKDAPAVEQWTRRRQVAFIVAASCALWLTLLAGAARVVHAVA